jgi:hypothetical protein
LGVLYLMIMGLWFRTLLGWLLLAGLGLPAIGAVEWLAVRFGAGSRRDDSSWRRIAYGLSVLIMLAAALAALRAIAVSWMDRHFWF